MKEVAGLWDKHNPNNNKSQTIKWTWVPFNSQLISLTNQEKIEKYPWLTRKKIEKLNTKQNCEYGYVLTELLYYDLHLTNYIINCKFSI